VKPKPVEANVSIAPPRTNCEIVCVLRVSVAVVSVLPGPQTETSAWALRLGSPAKGRRRSCKPKTGSNFGTFTRSIQTLPRCAAGVETTTKCVYTVQSATKRRWSFIGWRNHRPASNPTKREFPSPSGPRMGASSKGSGRQLRLRLLSLGAHFDQGT